MRKLVLLTIGAGLACTVSTAQAQGSHYTVDWMGIQWDNSWGDISLSANDTLLVTADQPAGMPFAGEAHYSTSADPIGPAPWVRVTYNDPGYPADFAQMIKVRKNWGTDQFAEVFTGAYSDSCAGTAGYYAGWFDQPTGYQGTVYFDVPRTPGLHDFEIGQRPDQEIDFLLDGQVQYTVTGLPMDFQDISLRNESPLTTTAEFTNYSAGSGYAMWGDLNCDGAVNGYDIDPFVLALTDEAGYEAQWPDCNRLNADVNGDGAVNGYDIDPFVALLVGN